MLARALKTEAKLTTEDAKKISQDIQKTIFQPVACNLLELYEEKKTADEWVDLARETEDQDEIVEYCSNALVLDPQNSFAWRGKGMALLGLEDYEKAIECFDELLKPYLDADLKEYPWWGKGLAFYELEEYEKAILEYEKVIKNYSRGNKVSYALLKQGLSFSKLGDKSSAKLLLQQVIKDYPNTNQAKIARAELAEIK